MPSLQIVKIQLHVPSALRTKYEAEWAPQPIWTV